MDRRTTTADQAAHGIDTEALSAAALGRVRRPCLVIVDLSNGFTAADSPIGCDCDEAIAATRRLLDAARGVGAPVVFTTVVYDDAGASSAAALLERLPPLRTLWRGSEAVEIDARIAPREGEVVLEKRFISAFFETGLASLLAAAGCDAVVVAGASTSGCVRATVVDALQHGYRTIVVEDAVADRSREAHAASLSDMALKYAHVVGLPTAEALFVSAGEARA